MPFNTENAAFWLLNVYDTIALITLKLLWSGGNAEFQIKGNKGEIDA